MSKRIEDALRVAQGLFLVAAQAAASSRFVKRVTREDLHAVTASAAAALQQTAKAAAATAPQDPAQDRGTGSKSNEGNSSRTVSSPYTLSAAFVAREDGQLLFRTAASPIPDLVGNSLGFNGRRTQAASLPVAHETSRRGKPEPTPAAALGTQEPSRGMSGQDSSTHLPTDAERTDMRRASASGPRRADVDRGSARTEASSSADEVAADHDDVIREVPTVIRSAAGELPTAERPLVLRGEQVTGSRVAATSHASFDVSRGTAADADALIQAAKAAPKRRFRERAVPSSQIGRAMGFASLGAGLAWGAATDAIGRAMGPASGASRGVLSEANASRLANALCRMRGAALKIGQMLSIQDEDMMPPQVAAALEKVRQEADVMPRRQLEATLSSELGDDWSTQFADFCWEPEAAASIGQVHRATLPDGRAVAVKVQYPGVADSINSDVDNLMSLLSIMQVFPKGLYIEQAVAVAKQELALECDYTYEAHAQQAYQRLLQDDPTVSRDFVAAEIVPELCSRRVLCSTWVPGVAIDKVQTFDQATRDRVGTALLRLTLQELFTWRFMQTDPNWGNFLYDRDTGKISLIDFGAARDFPKPFVDDYLRMVKACADQDRDEMLLRSVQLGFLTGKEPDVMLDAHVSAGAAVGTPFGTPGLYNFGAHNQLTKRVSALGATMLRHRQTAPPVEAYSLHRRLSGAFLANIKLRARVPCYDMFMDVYDRHSFSDDHETPEAIRVAA